VRLRGSNVAVLSTVHSRRRYPH